MKSGVQQIRLHFRLKRTYPLLIIHSGILVFLLIICTSNMIPNSSATTWIVDDDPGSWIDFISIQDAINASNESDTIRVFAGTYGGNITINKTLTLIGNGSHETNIMDNKSYVIRVYANNIIIDGFTIDGMGAGEGVYIYWGNSSIISNCSIQNSRGIRLAGNYHQIYNSNITNNLKHGIYLLHHSNNITISHSNIINNSKVGININRKCDNITISYCNISNNGNIGIGEGGFRQSYYLSVDHSIITNNYVGIGIKHMMYTNISYTTISGNLNAGIHITESDYTKIIRCHIVGNSGGGISIGTTVKKLILRYSNISDNKDVGLALGSNHCRVTMNTFYNNEGYGVSIDSQCWDYNKIHHNDFISNGDGSDSQALDRSEYNQWDNGSWGNYWSDYNGSDINGDGIGDVPYMIDGEGNATDRYPIIEPSPRFVVDDDFGPWADFNKIQDAINASRNGDTIRVYSGLYYENLEIGKSVRIIGNGTTTTVIHGYHNRTPINVSANSVLVDGFRIEGYDAQLSDSIIYLKGFENFQIIDSILSNGTSGIYMNSSSGSQIIRCTIQNTTLFGIQLDMCVNILINDTTISDSIIIDGTELEHFNTHRIEDTTMNEETIFYQVNTTYGTIPSDASEIILANCSNNSIFEYFVEDITVGIILAFCDNITVFNSTFRELSSGIMIRYSNGTMIENCSFYDNAIGIHVRSWNSTITYNHMINSSEYAIYLADGCRHTRTHHNDFKDNGNVPQGYDATGRNRWDDGSEGNYWSDYSGEDTDGDGIGDVPYVLDGLSNAEDRYPLMEPNSSRTGSWTWIVDDDFGLWADFNNIQNAINYVREGDTIRVYSGVYNESLLIDKSITLIGNGSDTTRVHGQDNNTQINVSSNNVTIEGFRIEGNGVEFPDSILDLSGSHNFNITDCVLKNGTTGITMNNSNGNRIIRCSIQNTSLFGIELDTCVNILIDKTDISNVIKIDGSALIHFNTHRIEDTLLNGKAVFYRANMTVGSVPSDASEIILANCSNLTVHDNHISGISLGITLAFCNDVMISDSTFRNLSTSIEVKYSDGTTIENCTFYDNKIGIDIRDGNGLVLLNHLYNSTDYAIYLGEGSNNVRVHHNIIVDSSNEPQCFDETGSNRWDDGSEGNYWSDYSGIDTNGNGIGDTPYSLDGLSNAEDRYPLMEPNSSRNGTWTWIVDDDLGLWADFDNIQEAINYVKEGDTIRIFSGIYDENLAIIKSVIVVGNGSTSTNVIGQENLTQIDVRANNVTIEKIRIDGDETDYPDSIVHVTGFNNFEIIDCILSDGISGITMNNSFGSQIIRCTIQNTTLYGIELESCRNVLINSTSITDAIMIKGTALAHFNTHRIENTDLMGKKVFYSSNTTTFSVPTDVGQIILANCSDVSISDHLIEDSSVGIELAFCDEVMVTNSTLKNLTTSITIRYSSSIIIRNCTFDDNTIGIDIRNGNGTISHNHLLNSLEYAIYLGAGSHNTKIHHNIIENSGNEPQCYDSAGENRWDDGSEGNYWSDYAGSDANDDGIGDTPYLISGGSDAKDRYPLLEKNGSRTGLWTWVVDDDFGFWADFDNIQEAIDYVEPNDTILVFEGHYEENLLVDKSLHIIGNGSNTTWLDGGLDSAVIDIEADHCTVFGFIIYGVNLSKYYQITVKSDNNSLQNNYLRRCAIELIHADNNTIQNNTIIHSLRGLYLFKSNQNSIVNNVITTGFWQIGVNDGIGIEIDSSHKNQIKDNRILHEEYCIVVQYSTDILIDDNTMNQTMIGVYLKDISDSNIMENTIGSVGESIIFESSNNSVIRSNQCYGSETYGIKIDYCTNFTIVDVEITIDISDGLWIDDSSDVFIQNVTVTQIRTSYSSVRAGISILDSENITINDSTTSACSVGISIGRSNSIWIENSISKGNHFSGIHLFGSYDIMLNSSVFQNNTVGTLVNDYYWECDNITFTDLSITDNECGLMIANGTNILIDDSTIWDNQCGIDVEFGSYISIANCTFYSNTNASVDFIDSFEIELISNIVNNSKFGIRINQSEKIELIGNLLYDNEYGVYFEKSNSSVIRKNTISNNTNGLFIEGSLKSRIVSSVLFSNTLNGILCYDSVGILINSSTIRDNQIGINISDCLNGGIFDNICTENEYYGILVSDSNGFHIARTNSNNSTGGIVITRSSDVVMDNNSCAYNRWGINVYQSSHCEIFYNDLSNNQYGLKTRYMNDSSVFSNNIYDNYYVGTLMSLSSWNSIYNNQLVNNDGIGFHLLFSNSNTFSQNEVTGNEYGFSLWWSDSNIIRYNELIENVEYAVYLTSECNLTVVHHNTFTANGDGTSQGYDDGSNNFWDDGAEGNWWSDYDGIDTDGDGIGEFPYPIDGGADTVDRYPFTEYIGSLQVIIGTNSDIPLEGNLVIIFVKVIQNFKWNDTNITLYIDGEQSQIIQTTVENGTSFFTFEWIAEEGSHNIRVVVSGLMTSEDSLTIFSVKRSNSSSNGGIPSFGVIILSLLLAFLFETRRFR